MNKRILFMGLAAAALLLLPMVAMASLSGFDLNTPNAAGSVYVGPYAHVDITVPDGGGVATFDVTAAQTGFMNPGLQPVTYTLGGKDMFALNGPFTIDTNSFQTVSYPGFTSPTIKLQTNKKVSEFGVFDNVFKAKDGYSSSVSEFKFSTMGTTYSDAAAVEALLLANLTNTAAHVFPSLTSGINNGAVSDAFIAGNGGQGVAPIPVPPTVLLLGSGLTGLALLGRRKAKQ
ncbi:MAG: hypothetical protein Q7V36_00660 [Deltaproteobacteria bacterium]|nr:hypothetical protein [Deltaproteobacteria bacterium]